MGRNLKKKKPLKFQRRKDGDYFRVVVNIVLMSARGLQKARQLADRLGGKPQRHRMTFEGDPESFPIPNEFVFQNEGQAREFVSGMAGILEIEGDNALIGFDVEFD